MRISSGAVRTLVVQVLSAVRPALGSGVTHPRTVTALPKKELINSCVVHVASALVCALRLNGVNGAHVRWQGNVSQDKPTADPVDSAAYANATALLTVSGVNGKRVSVKGSVRQVL